MFIPASHARACFSSDPVGSILRVTTADPYASGKTSQFLGICIQRSGKGLGATFTLRNTIEGQGIFLLVLPECENGFSPGDNMCFAVDRDLCSLFNELLEGLLSFESFLLYGQHPLGLDFLGWAWSHMPVIIALGIC